MIIKGLFSDVLLPNNHLRTCYTPSSKCSFFQMTLTYIYIYVDDAILARRRKHFFVYVMNFVLTYDFIFFLLLIVFVLTLSTNYAKKDKHMSVKPYKRRTFIKCIVMRDTWNHFEWPVKHFSSFV